LTILLQSQRRYNNVAVVKLQFDGACAILLVRYHRYNLTIYTVFTQNWKLNTSYDICIDLCIVHWVCINKGCEVLVHHALFAYTACSLLRLLAWERSAACFLLWMVCYVNYWLRDKVLFDAFFCVALAYVQWICSLEISGVAMGWSGWAKSRGPRVKGPPSSRQIFKE